MRQSSVALSSAARTLLPTRHTLMFRLAYSLDRSSCTYARFIWCTGPYECLYACNCASLLRSSRSYVLALMLLRLAVAQARDPKFWPSCCKSNTL